MSITCLKDDVPAAVELLGDVVMNPKLDDAAIDAGRDAAIERLKDFEDDKQGRLMHGLHVVAYDSTDHTPGAGLGLCPFGMGDLIQGTNAPHRAVSVWESTEGGTKGDALDASDVQGFHETNVSNAAGCVLVASGGVDVNAFNEAAQRAFGGLANKPAVETDYNYVGVDQWFVPTIPPGNVDQAIDTKSYANHHLQAWEIPGLASPDLIPLQVITELHGSWDRLQHDLHGNFLHRQNYEDDQSQMQRADKQEYTPMQFNYSDTGLLGWYFIYLLGQQVISVKMDGGSIICSEAIWKLAGEASGYWFIKTNQEMLCRYAHRLTNYECDRGKVAALAKILSCENGNTNAVADRIAEQVLLIGRHVPFEDYYARIDDLTTQQTSDVIDHYYYDRDPVVVNYALSTHLPRFNYIRRATMRWRT